MIYLQVITDILICLPVVGIGLLFIGFARKKKRRAFWVGVAICALLTLALLVDAGLLLLGFSGLL